MHVTLTLKFYSLVKMVTFMSENILKFENLKTIISIPLYINPKKALIKKLKAYYPRSQVLILVKAQVLIPSY